MGIKRALHNMLTIKFDKAFGLDIGDRSIEIIELDKLFRFSVAVYGRAELPTGVVENGRIVDQNILAEKLKKLLKEAKPRKVSTNKVIVSLPESQVFVECFVVESKLKGDNLERAIEDKMATTLPVSLNKLYWDFAEKNLPDKTKKLIILVGVPKDIASGYVKFCNSIGLEIVSICVESLSLARAILKRSDKQSLIMDIGAHSTNLGFFDSNDKINMSITIPVAGDSFTEAIQGGLRVERDEAEALKYKFGLKEIKDNKVRDLLIPVLLDLLKETEGAINYYEKTFNQKLDNIYLLGGSSLLPGLPEMVKANLKREIQAVVNGNNLNLRFLSEKARDFSLYANVIGLGMLGASGEFRDINILKQIPASEANVVNKLNLFKMGYLSRINTFRMIINNKIVLGMMIIVIALIFTILIQQAQNYGFASVSDPLLNTDF